jgi:uncharacterized protein (TIGR02145 family)
MKYILIISGVVFSFFLIFIVYSCKKEKPTPPVVLTNLVTEISCTTASVGGDVTNEGSSSIISRGVCWDINGSPTIEKSKTFEFLGLGSFTHKITKLTPNTTYYVKAYATNGDLTGYGNEQSFATLDISNATNLTPDIEGNIYSITTIGTQVWMTENLKTTKYNDGNEISLVIDNTSWLELSTPAYCSYNNVGYGALYNWYAVNTGKLCPIGWHVPNDTDWTALMEFLGGSNIAGGKLKDTGYWLSPNNGATNESGFAALPGGWRLPTGEYQYIGEYGFWWSSIEYDALSAMRWVLGYSMSDFIGNGGWNKKLGCSVRCIKD